MATQMQKDRRLRAVSMVENRIEFWKGQTEETVEVDGKACNSAAKLSQAEYELMRLKSKP